MVGVSGPALVLWVHIVAACIWIGGQVTVAVLIPLLRDQRELARRVGRRYQAVAWPAFAVLILTGVVNAGNAGLRWSQLLDSPAGRTLVVKLGLVALSGLAAGVHAFLQAPRRGPANGGSAVGSAVLGSISVGAALLAALYGVAIAGA
ncbi:MAG TPA: CopD family protein [Candidatus Saccharimonadales bacterium]|nr:CopD family protein [Candidatus Saccharimonadales bacterium]